MLPYDSIDDISTSPVPCPSCYSSPASPTNNCRRTISDRHKCPWFPSTSTSQTLLPPLTSLIPMSVSSRVDRMPSYTFLFTPGTLHTTFLIPHHTAQQGHGSTSCPALSTTPSSSLPSALLVYTRVVQSLALQSAIMTVPSSFSMLTCRAPRVSMVLPSGSVN